MVKVHREQGLRILIFSDDHEPVHVHVFGDGPAKINLVGPDGGPHRVWADDMKRSDIRHAMRLVGPQMPALLLTWREIHG